MRVLRRSNIEEFMLILALVCRVQLIKNVKMNKFQFEIKLPKSNYRLLVDPFKRFSIFNNFYNDPGRQESLEICLEFIFDHKRCGLAIAEKKVETFIIIMMAKHRFSRRFMTTGPLCNEFLLSPHHFQVRAC